jgi:hypothetical protein
MSSAVLWPIPKLGGPTRNNFHDASASFVGKPPSVVAGSGRRFGPAAEEGFEDAIDD